MSLAKVSARSNLILTCGTLSAQAISGQESDMQPLNTSGSSQRGRSGSVPLGTRCASKIICSCRPYARRLELVRARSALLHNYSFLYLLFSLDPVQVCITALVHASFCSGEGAGVRAAEAAGTDSRLQGFQLQNLKYRANGLLKATTDSDSFP